MEKFFSEVLRAIDALDAPLPRNANEWAAENRVFPPDSPSPGPFKKDIAPYTTAICDAMNNPNILRVAIVMGTQQGKSVTMENIVGQRLSDCPVQIIYMAPTENLIAKVIAPKFEEMFLNSNLKEVSEKITMLQWSVNGTTIRFVYAGSAAEMSAQSAGLILVDEVDRIVNTSEGDSTEIIEARGDAYADSKVVYAASPTHGPLSRRKHPKTGIDHFEVIDLKAAGSISKIWEIWQSGTRKEWAVPCPYCNEYFIPHSGLLSWPGKDTEEECTPSVAFKKAFLACPNNGCSIENAHRRKMNKKGLYLAPGQYVEDGVVKGVADTEGNNTESFFVSGLCSFSSKKSYGFLAEKLLKALNSGDEGTIQSVYNTGFAELYDKRSDAPSEDEVKSNCESYRLGSVLGEPLALVAGVDVQKRSLYYVVRALYPGKGSILVEADELFGDITKQEVWDELKDVLNADYDGHEIRYMGIDTAYEPEIVQEFVNANKPRAIALRGVWRQSSLIKQVRLEANRPGTSMRGSVRYNFDATACKQYIHSRIGRGRKYSAFWALPEDIHDEYCKQIGGEYFDEKLNKFIPVGANHYLDCEAMIYALASLKKYTKKPGKLFIADLLGDSSVDDANTDDVNTDEATEAAPLVAKAVVQKKPKKQTQSSWVRGGR